MKRATSKKPISNSRIVPLNLPAQMERQTLGNPVTTRLESAIANCYPGLEADIRNLDRRFFPGLVFSFVSSGDPDDPSPNGAKLTDVDLADPDLTSPPPDKEKLELLSNAISSGQAIFLDALTADGVRISLRNEKNQPYDWDVAWRLVRSLRAGKLSIELNTRPSWPTVQHFPMTLVGSRRKYQDESGQISDAYHPGELTQSLCSPWQHDFRDCGCSFWASNRPDISLPARPAAEHAEDPVIWIRWDRFARTPPKKTVDQNRPFEIDTYEINERWKDLPFVLENRERWDEYLASPEEPRRSVLDEKNVKGELRRLAGIEQALALEYLYARYSVRFGDSNLTPEEQLHADFIAHELLVIAISEMTHLHWVNVLLKELTNPPNAKITGPYRPALKVSPVVPPKNRKTRSTPLVAAIDDFIAAEAPSGTIDGQYAELLELFTLRKYPQSLIGLVERIIADGVTHHSRFCEIKSLLARYPGRLVRDLKDLKDGDPSYALFVKRYQELIASLDQAYRSGSPATKAHELMIGLDQKITEQARRKKPRAVPLVEIALKKKEPQKR